MDAQEQIQSIFNIIKTEKNPKKDVLTCIKDYDEKYEEFLHELSTKNISEEKFNRIYNELIKNRYLKDKEEIAYALATNPYLPDSIVNDICFQDTRNQMFYNDLFQNHKNKMNISTFQKVYKKCSFNILSPILSLKYKDKITLKDIPYNSELMKQIAYEELKVQINSPRYYGCQNENVQLYRYIDDENVIDEILKKLEEAVKNDTSNVILSIQEKIVTEIENNTLISEEKRDKIFDEYGGDFDKLKNPTFKMMNIMYDSLVEALFEYNDTNKFPGSGIELVNNESILTGFIRRNQLTYPMEYDLINRLVSLNNRKSNRIALTLAEYSPFSNIAHIALQLKSTNDRDAALGNPNLPVTDIQKYAMTYAKKVQKQLDKYTFPSRKHVNMLTSFAYRARLPDEVYQILLNLKSASIGLVLCESKYTPKHILEEIYRDTQTENRGKVQELISSIRLYSLEHKLPQNKTEDLLQIIKIDKNNREKEDFLNYNRKIAYQDFIQDNPELETYKNLLHKLHDKITEENVKNTIEKIFRGLEAIKTYKPPKRKPLKEKDVHELTDKELLERRNDTIEVAMYNMSLKNKSNFYTNIRKQAKTLQECNKEIENRTLLLEKPLDRGEI